MIEIYLHTAPSGKQYVGLASQGWRARWRSHVFDARRGSRLPLHAAIRRYGSDAFRTEVLQTCSDRTEAEAAERRWIAELSTQVPLGYNATAGGDGTHGLSDTARRRIGRAHCGKVVSALTIDRQSRPRPGRRVPHSAEHRAKINAALKGKKLTAETRDKLRAANLGKIQSDETKAKRATSMRAAWARRSSAERANVGARIARGKLKYPALRIACAWRAS